MVWEPKTCCCGTSIKTGTLVLGWMGVIGYALNLISMLRFAAFSREDLIKICQNITESMDVEVCAHGIIGSIIASTITGVLGVAMCGMLLWGVSECKPMMMLPYLIVQGMGLVILGIGTVVLFIVLACSDVVLGAFIALIILCGIMVLDGYLFLVVRACYIEVKQHSLAIMGGTNIAYVEQRDDIPYKM